MVTITLPLTQARLDKRPNRVLPKRDRIPMPRILATMEVVAERTPAKVNSFKCLIREILASRSKRSRSWRKNSSAEFFYLTGYFLLWDTPQIRPL